MTKLTIIGIILKHALVLVLQDLKMNLREDLYGLDLIKTWMAVGMKNTKNLIPQSSINNQIMLLILQQHSHSITSFFKIKPLLKRIGTAFSWQMISFWICSLNRAHLFGTLMKTVSTILTFCLPAIVR